MTIFAFDILKYFGEACAGCMYYRKRVLVSCTFIHSILGPPQALRAQQAPISCLAHYMTARAVEVRLGDPYELVCRDA